MSENEQFNEKYLQFISNGTTNGYVLLMLFKITEKNMWIRHI